MRPFPLPLVLIALLFAAGCSGERRTTADRPYRLETVGPAQVVRLYADGFERLTPRERVLAYYLSLASIAARDIALDQRHPDALEVRDLCEGIFRHRSAVDSATALAITRYLKLFWINNGFYDHLTARKFTPECTPAAFTAAAEAAQRAGAALATGSESLPEKLRRLAPVLFDPQVDPVLTTKAPGTDWLRGSAVNYYGRGLTLAEVDRWAQEGGERHPLNARVVREEGKLVEQVWRAGGGDTPPGMYAGPLTAAVSWLERAIPLASSEHQARTVRMLIRFLRSGEAEDFRSFNIHWVKDTSAVDFILGFIEDYLDPRGRKAEFEASVFFTDPGQTALMQNLAARAQYFEDRAPWRPEYRKTIDRVPVANVVNAVASTGGTGPIPPLGINLPNEQAIREQHGSKSILLGNVQTAYERSIGVSLVREFAWDEEEIRTEERYGSLADNLHTAMHEVIGHGSGKVSPKLAGRDPAEFLPGYANTLEEARADLVAMWNAWDPALVEIGVAQDAAEARKIGETLFRQRVRTALTQLRRIGRSEHLEQDHLKNRQLIAHYLLRHSAGVRLERRDGKSYYRVVDFDAARATAGELLAEIMRIKAEGDLTAARRLVDTYGLAVDTALRDEVQERTKALQLPTYTAFVMPKIEPVLDPQARVTDATLTYPPDFATQMLEYSDFTRAFR